MAEGNSRGAVGRGRSHLLAPNPEAGFVEELDKSTVPWRGRGTFRFVRRGAPVGARVFSREDVEAIATAAYQAPQEIELEHPALSWTPARWWTYEGNYYYTRADLHPREVAEWIAEYYRRLLVEWGGPIFFNEAPYLGEWLEFHLLQGVERFYLYDHESTDSSRQVLAPYIEDGTVVVYDWPIYPGQQEALEHCAEHHRFDCRWLAFVDIDEFLFSPAGRPLPEVLRDYERWPGVVVNRPAYGSSGHNSMPNGLAIESYVLRSNASRRTVVCKTIAQPEYLDETPLVHSWTYPEGFSVDELKRPAPFAKALSPSISTLRLNHYWTRSREESERKLATPTATRQQFRTWSFETLDARLNEVTDAAATAYAPAVKDALRRRRL